MHQLPIHWYEGLFLRPHHFQASDRHLAEHLQVSLEFDHPYAYGVRSIELGERALENQHFEVRTLRARMLDGTIIELGAGQSLDRLDLKPAFEKQGVVRVFLAVPRLQLGTTNIDHGSQPEVHARFREQPLLLQDESRGGNDKEVRVKALNLRLLSSQDDQAGYEVLPLAQVVRASDQGAVPRLDDEYYPPVLAIEAWPPLGRDVVVAVGDIVGRKIDVLANQVASREITFDSDEPGDLERLLLLDRLYVASASLTVLTSARGVHPFAAYLEIARIVGTLAIFGRDREIPKIQPYDHDDLARVFRELMDLLSRRINFVRDSAFEQRYFGGTGAVMEVTLEPHWLGPNWQWFIGVYKEEITDDECRQLLQAGRLDWKIGSTRQVESLFSRGFEGLQLIPLTRANRVLPANRNWVYFEMSRSNDVWRDVQSSQTLAIRFRDSLVLNFDRPPGERRLLVGHGTKQVALEFALFAIPNTR